MEIEDPWNVDTLEEFLYYCCPECKDERIQRKEDFIKHALDEHPKSKISVTKIILVKKENSIELSQGTNISGRSIDIENFENACDIEYFVKSENNEHWNWHNNSKPINHLKNEPSFENEDQRKDQSNDSIVPEDHKIFECKSCGKSFSSAQYLKKHIHTIHEGHKDYNCEYCGKSFSQKISLTKHIHTVHEGHKDFKCESCGESFSCATNLKKHIIIFHELHNSVVNHFPKKVH